MLWDTWDLPGSGIEPCIGPLVSCIGRWILSHGATKEAPHTHSFTNCLWLLSQNKDRVQWLEPETLWPPKLKICTIWPFTENIFQCSFRSAALFFLMYVSHFFPLQMFLYNSLLLLSFFNTSPKITWQISKAHFNTELYFPTCQVSEGKMYFRENKE